MSSGLLPVLSVEDEESDVIFLRHAFKKANVGHPLIHLKDGQEAVHYLSGTAPYGDRNAHPLPALILLDLKMPRMTGFDVLAWIGKRPELKAIPVVVLTSSTLEEDIRLAKVLGARDYVVKPNGTAQFVTIVQRLQECWLHCLSKRP